MQQGLAALSRLIAELDALLATRDLRFADLVGRTADALEDYGQQPARPGHWQRFVPPEAL
jgi:hypothetical protein